MPRPSSSLVERRGAREQDHVVGVLDARDPDLLPVHHVPVALPRDGLILVCRCGVARSRHGLQGSFAAGELRQVLRFCSRCVRTSVKCCTSGRGCAGVAAAAVHFLEDHDASVSEPEPLFRGIIARASRPCHRLDELDGNPSPRRACASRRCRTARRARTPSRIALMCPGRLLLHIKSTVLRL